MYSSSISLVYKMDSLKILIKNIIFIDILPIELGLNNILPTLYSE